MEDRPGTVHLISSVKMGSSIGQCISDPFSFTYSRSYLLFYPLLLSLSLLSFFLSFFHSHTHTYTHTLSLSLCLFFLLHIYIYIYIWTHSSFLRSSLGWNTCKAESWPNTVICSVRRSVSVSAPRLYSMLACGVPVVLNGAWWFIWRWLSICIIYYIKWNNRL